jgi:hypothetical protein
LYQVRVTSYSGSALVPAWNNIAEARLALDTISPGNSTTHGHVDQIAFEWGRSVTSNFKRLNTFRPEVLRGLALDNSNIVLTRGIFGGVDSSGALVLFVTTVTFDGAKVDSTTRSQLACSWNNVCAIGEVEIVDEFVHATSSRAKQEAVHQGPRNMDTPLSYDHDMQWAMRLVELTIKYHQGTDVGESVDAVQLRRGGGAHWYSRKDDCKQNAP